jgi:DNA (cytosine-5)-methyltransferase 1
MYNSLSLFSGIGGLCEGAKLAGFNIAGAAEMDKYACESYRANFPSIPLFEGNVADLLAGDENHELQQSKYAPQQVDLIFGGPPCQGFSQIGPRDPFDPRNELYLEMCRLAKILVPKVIVIENVPNMILMKKGMFKERIIESLSKIGYSNIGLLKLCADQYGIPQSRNRIFFIAVKDGFIRESAQSVFESVANSMVREPVTVNEALTDLPKIVADDSGVELKYPSSNNRKISSYMKEMRLDFTGEKYNLEEKVNVHKLHADTINLQNHHTKDVREKRKKIIELLEPGAKADSLPKELWDNKRPEKWRRFHGDRFAHTLLAHMHRDLSEWIHPKHNRWITVREAMRLQGFHDGFVLKTSEWQQLKQVGNAVPPFLGEVPTTAARVILDLGISGKTDFQFRGQLGLI